METYSIIDPIAHAIGDFKIMKYFKHSNSTGVKIWFTQTFPESLLRVGQIAGGRALHNKHTQKDDMPSWPNAKGLKDHLYSMLILLHLPDTTRLYFWPRNVIFSACKITQKVGYCKSLESYARIIWYACTSATFITNSNVFPTKFDWYKRP